VHIVGFITRIYHDARSLERQTELKDFTHQLNTSLHSNETDLLGSFSV